MAFTGRERELARLAAAISRAADGRPSRVSITGKAGIGTTALLDELCRRLAGRPDVTIARAAALAPASAEPFQAIGDALGAALAPLPPERVAAVIGAAGHDLARLLPDRGERLAALGIATDPPPLTAPDQLGSRVREAVLGALVRLAGDGVLLLALEDLHHADPATRSFLRTLLRLERALPICLVLAWQPDEIDRRHPSRDLLDAVAADPATEPIELGPLDADAIERLVRGLPGDPPEGAVVAAVVTGSAGNALVATQLVAARRLPLAGVRLSDPFEQVAVARLAALGPAARSLVRLLAIAREPLPRRLVLGPGIPTGRVTVVSIAEAVASGLVTDDGERLSIAHERYAEAIADDELPADRAAIHAALARVLGAWPARAAWHHDLAGRGPGRREAHLAAADEAAALDPGRTTRFHLDRALEPSGDDDRPADETATLLVRAARATAADGGFRRAADLLRRAADALAGGGGRPDGTLWDSLDAAADGDGAIGAGPAATATDALTRDDAWRLATAAIHEEAARCHWAAGDPAAARRVLDQALGLLPAGPSPERARILATSAQHRMIEGRFNESAHEAEAACDVAREAGDAALRELGHATCTLGVDIAYLGALSRGLTLLADADAIARRTGRLDDLMRVAANRTTLLDLDARRDDALAVVAAGIREAEAGGLAGTYGSFLRGNAADILWQLGRWDASERECRAGMEWQPAGVAWFSPTLYLGLLLVESRGDDEAASLVGRTLLQLDTVPAGQWSALVQRAAVSLALWRGDPADALRVAEREWDRIVATEDPVQVALGASTTMEAAAAAADHGRTERDMGLLATATGLGTRVLASAADAVRAGALPPGIAAHGEAELHLATARAHGDRLRGRPSADAWARLATAWGERGIPYPAAKARWWQTLALLDAGAPRADARAALAESWRIAAALPARPLLRTLADLARRARLPLPTDVAIPADLALVPGSAAPVVAVPVGPGPAAPEAAAPPADPPAGLPATPGDRVAAEGDPEAVIEPQDAAQAPARPAVAFPIGEPPPWAGLSPRELDVLRYICEGRSDREIGERLYISERTVHVHVRHLLAKLGVPSRTRAASLALRHGLLPAAAQPGDRDGAGGYREAAPVANEAPNDDAAIPAGPASA